MVGKRVENIAELKDSRSFGDGDYFLPYLGMFKSLIIKVSYETVRR